MRLGREIMIGLSLICPVLLVTTNWDAHNLIVGVLRQWKTTTYTYRKEQINDQSPMFCPPVSRGARFTLFTAEALRLKDVE